MQGVGSTSGWVLDGACHDQTDVTNEGSTTRAHTRTIKEVVSLGGSSGSRILQLLITAFAAAEPVTRVDRDHLFPAPKQRQRILQGQHRAVRAHQYLGEVVRVPRAMVVARRRVDRAVGVAGIPDGIDTQKGFPSPCLRIAEKIRVVPASLIPAHRDVQEGLVVLVHLRHGGGLDVGQGILREVAVVALCLSVGLQTRLVDVRLVQIVRPDDLLREPRATVLMGRNIQPPGRVEQGFGIRERFDNAIKVEHRTSTPC
mmetsp:Transcript_190/g.315  ORF Transcript_190/g.315 Transcript_190/m.315 type:complete len:257 (-) Transcript_190:889-1659(-)